MVDVNILPQFGRRNPAITGLFQKDNEWFVADLAVVPYFGNECMIFRSDKDGHVESYIEQYCDRNSDRINEDNLRRCIEEFCSPDYECNTPFGMMESALASIIEEDEKSICEEEA